MEIHKPAVLSYVRSSVKCERAHAHSGIITKFVMFGSLKSNINSDNKKTAIFDMYKTCYLLVDLSVLNCKIFLFLLSVKIEYELGTKYLRQLCKCHFKLR